MGAFQGTLVQKCRGCQGRKSSRVQPLLPSPVWPLGCATSPRCPGSGPRWIHRRGGETQCLAKAVHDADCLAVHTAHTAHTTHTNHKVHTAHMLTPFTLFTPFTPFTLFIWHHHSHRSHCTHCSHCPHFPHCSHCPHCPHCSLNPAKARLELRG